VIAAPTDTRVGEYWLAAVESTVVTPLTARVSEIRAKPPAVLLVLTVKVSFAKLFRIVATPFASLMVPTIRVVVTEDESAVDEVLSHVI